MTGAISLIVAAPACVHSSAQENLPPSVQAKLDPALLHRLEELNQLGRLEQPLSVLVRTTSEISPDQERLLERRGMTIRSKSGIILSATLPAASIQDVAGLDFIARIELSKRLKPRED